MGVKSIYCRRAVILFSTAVIGWRFVHGRSSEYRIGVTSLFIVVVVTLVGVGLDRLLAFEGVSRVDIRILSNAFTGVVAGAFLYVYARKE